ncbi:MAG: hypothetical protein ABIL01_09430 [Pseudomonadota bacterium]|jgi:hypothetical protein
MPRQIRLTPPPTLLMAPRAISYARSILPALEQFGVLDDMIAVGHTVGDRVGAFSEPARPSSTITMRFATSPIGLTA